MVVLRGTTWLETFMISALFLYRNKKTFMVAKTVRNWVRSNVLLMSDDPDDDFFFERTA